MEAMAMTKRKKETPCGSTDCRYYDDSSKMIQESGGPADDCQVCKRFYDDRYIAQRGDASPFPSAEGELPKDKLIAEIKDRKAEIPNGCHPMYVNGLIRALYIIEESEKAR
jgi:hypothetical protein